MAILNFPDNPQVDDQYTGDNGTTYTYDGVKWVGRAAGGAAGTNSLQNGSFTVQVDVDGNLVLPVGSIIKDAAGDPVGGTSFTTGTVDLHNGGVQSAQILQFDNSTLQSVITGPTPTAGNSAQRLIIQGQRATGSGEGGDVYVWGGDAQTDGGDIKIYAGDADSNVSGEGGYVNIAAGRGYTQGGDVTITAGYTSSQSGTPGNIRLRTTAGDWSFDWTGTLTLPPNGGIVNSSGSSVLDPKDRLVNGSNQVVLDTDGILTLPSSGAIQQRFTWTRVVQPTLSTTSAVIWTALYDYISSVKLTIQLEANETGDATGWHSQVCEAIIASRGYANSAGGPLGDPAMTVYGVTYTSTVPLATFTVQRNPTTKQIEIVGTQTAACGSSPNFRIHSVEMSTRD